MKFLITGINGFVGPHLANCLISNGHSVTGLTRSGRVLELDNIVDTSKIHFITGSLNNKKKLNEIIKDNKYDGIFHLASLTHPPTSFKEPDKYFYNNTQIAINLCNAILKYSPQTILCHVSTPEVYGICPSDKEIAEDLPMNPMNPYGVSKAAADMYVLERARNAGLKAFLTRSFSQTGARRPSNYSISSDAVQIANIILGKQEPIIRVGNLSAKRAVTDVRDIVRAYYGLMMYYILNKNMVCGVYHISRDDVHEIGFYLQRMIDLYNLKVELTVDPLLVRPIDIPIQIPNSDKIKKLIGWKPEISIDDMLKDLVEYWIKKIKG